MQSLGWNARPLPQHGSNSQLLITPAYSYVEHHILEIYVYGARSLSADRSRRLLPGIIYRSSTDALQISAQRCCYPSTATADLQLSMYICIYVAPVV